MQCYKRCGHRAHAGKSNYLEKLLLKNDIVARFFRLLSVCEWGRKASLIQRRENIDVKKGRERKREREREGAIEKRKRKYWCIAILLRHFQLREITSGY